jgi:hypothetical protein
MNWWQTPEAIDLLRTIKAKAPAETLVHSDHSNWGGNVYGYRTRETALLRKLHEAALTRAMAKDDAAFLAGDRDACSPERSEFGKVLRDKPDDVIAKVLSGEIALPAKQRRAA